MNSLLSVFVGGLLAISGSSVVKWLEYFVERRSLRAAFKAEIGGMIEIVERRDHAALLADVAAAWRQGDDGVDLALFGIDDDFHPVYSANVSRVGLLGADVRFYTMLFSVSADLRAHMHGQTNHWSLDRRADLMERDTAIWHAAMALGKALLARL
jgi:hypothetical protein